LTTLSDLEGNARDFFMAIHRATEGQTDPQISMHTVGETIGLDREASSAAAEDLMALGLVEIRTLAGAIGLSSEGADLMADPSGSEGGHARRLGTESPMSSSQHEMVEAVLIELKHGLASSGLAYEGLAEMMADIRTIEAQIASPRAKTAIVRECLASMMAVAAQHRQEDWQRQLETLLA
jgi:hypothetical protein